MNYLLENGIIAYLRNRASDDGIAVHAWMGRWRVRWRDFSTTKQDREFDTEEEARKLATKIRYSDITQELDEMNREDRESAAVWWIELMQHSKRARR